MPHITLHFFFSEGEKGNIQIHHNSHYLFDPVSVSQKIIASKKQQFQLDILFHSDTAKHI